MHCGHRLIHGLQLGTAKNTIGQNEMIRLILVLALMLSVFGIMGSLDYADEVAQELAYCQDVQDKVYPDYKELKNICREVLTKQK